MQSITLPLGSLGPVVLSETGGVVTVTGNLAVFSGVVKLGFTLEGGLPDLLKLLASESSNSIVKGILSEVGVASALLP